MEWTLALLAIASCKKTVAVEVTDAVIRGNAVADAGPVSIANANAETAVPDLSIGCHEYAEAMCTAFDRCNPAGTPVLYGDLTACVRRLERECLLEGQHAASAVTNDSLHRCAIALPAKVCPVDREEPECAVPPGRRANGRPCVARAQCQSSWCETEGDAVCGTCTKPKYPPSPHAATTLGAANDSCTNDSDCVLGFACDKRKCRPVTIGKVGDACTEHPWVASYPGGMKPCGPDLECVGKKCVARPKDGEACTSKDGAHCFFPSSCRNGTCAAPPKDCPL